MGWVGPIWKQKTIIDQNLAHNARIRGAQLMQHYLELTILEQSPLKTQLPIQIALMIAMLMESI